MLSDKDLSCMIVLTLVVTPPWNNRCWALPILSVPASQSADIYREAEKWCEEKIAGAKQIVEEFATHNSLGPGNPCDSLKLDDLCFIVTGSIGRNEALGASDMDIIPVARNTEALGVYRPFDQEVREQLRDRLKVGVSQGQNLTKLDVIDSLVDPESIGGPKDTSQCLTKRMLILTEGRQVAGCYSLEDIRQIILKAYGSKKRSSGRHTLSLCNDIARYYRTLCIEYKTKADVADADWCTRNLKLRHSRKIWYFANIITIVKLAESHPEGEGYDDELLQRFCKPPTERLCEALQEMQPIEIGSLLETYSFFLEFMSSEKNRSTLSNIDYEKRYEIDLQNPFPMMKFNSDVLHNSMIKIIDGLPRSTRQRVLDWFLL